VWLDGERASTDGQSMSEGSHNATEHGSEQAIDPLARHVESERRRFLVILNVALWITVVFAAGNLAVALVWREQTFVFGTAILAGFAIVGLVARSRAARGDLGRAAQIVAAGTLLFSIPLSIIIPDGAAAVALVIVLAVTAVLGYVKGRPLRTLIVASVTTSVLTGVLASLTPPPAAANSPLMLVLRACGPAATTLVILLMLTQYSTRLSNTLEREAAARRDAEAATRQAEALVGELQAALLARDDFISVAAHELRTPLTSLRLDADRLQRLVAREESPEGPSSAVRRVRRQTDRLVRLVENLLDVSRIMSGKLELEREQIDLGALAAEVVDAARDDIERSGSNVALHADANVRGRWDRTRIETAIANLLGNALKYGARKPIEIEVHRVDDRAVVHVRDQGIGVAPEQRERIFDRFERAVPTRNYGGLGLGLWIVRQIAEAHGGSVRVESEPEKGSTFTLELPLG
jgi:signal transduction histidine kinase